MDTSSELDLPTVTQLLNNYKGKQPSIRPPLRSSHSDSDSDSDLDAGAPSLNIRSPLSLISPNKSSPSTSYKRYRVRKGFSGEAFREDPFFDPDEYPVLEKTNQPSIQPSSKARTIRRKSGGCSSPVQPDEPVRIHTPSALPAPLPSAIVSRHISPISPHRRLTKLKTSTTPRKPSFLSRASTSAVIPPEIISLLSEDDESDEERATVEAFVMVDFPSEEDDDDPTYPTPPSEPASVFKDEWGVEGTETFTTDEGVLNWSPPPKRPISIKHPASRTLPSPSPSASPSPTPSKPKPKPKAKPKARPKATAAVSEENARGTIKNPNSKPWKARREKLSLNLVSDLDEAVFKGNVRRWLGLDHVHHGDEGKEKEVPQGVVWTGKLKTTAGMSRWCRKDGGSSREGVRHYCKIELSTKILNTEDKVLSTTAHELCHLATWIFDGKDTMPHGKEFKAWAQKVMDYRPDINITTRHDFEITHKYQWICDGCSASYGRDTKSIDASKQCCGKCKGKLVPQWSVSTPVKPNAYREFVKENFKTVGSSGMNASEVMKLVAEKWRERERGETTAAEELFQRDPPSTVIMYTLSTSAILDHLTWSESAVPGPQSTTPVPQMTAVRIEHEFSKAHGHDPALQGTGCTHLTWSHPTSEQVGTPSIFTGQTLFVGHIGRRQGSLTLSCSGTYTPRTGNLKADLEVLFGTGDLAGVQGDGGWERLVGPPDSGTPWTDLASHSKVFKGTPIELDLKFPQLA